MAYLGYKNAAYRKWKREQEEIKKWNEAEKVNQRDKAKLKAKSKHCCSYFYSNPFYHNILLTMK